MLPGLVPPTGLAMDVRGETMRLRVLRARVQDADELSERLFPVAFVEICPGQDEARRRVLRKADEALLTEPDGLARPADLAIRVGQRGKGESSRVFGEAFFVATDCAGRHGIGGGNGPSDLGDRVRHGSSFICAKGARVNAFPRLPASARRDRLARMQGDADSGSARPHVSDQGRFLLPLAAVVLTFLCYLPALSNGFIDWDDSPLLLRNPHYRGLGLEQLRWMFTSRLMGHWMPLNWISFGLHHAVWAYLKYCEGRASADGGGRWPYWAAVVLCGLALMSKVMAVSLPVILLLLDVYPLRRLGGGPRGWLGPAARAVLVEKLPFVALCAG